MSSALVAMDFMLDHSFLAQVSCELSLEYLSIKPNALISYSFFACVPNLMLQIVAVMINSVTRTKVTLLPVGSCGIRLGYSKRSRLLPCKMEGQIELCIKVCAIVTELHQISTNLFVSRIHYESRENIQ